nr:MAG TPA: hypothetical protein [Bacteriophage sp.]
MVCREVYPKKRDAPRTSLFFRPGTYGQKIT